MNIFHTNGQWVIFYIVVSSWLSPPIYYLIGISTFGYDYSYDMFRSLNFRPKKEPRPVHQNYTVHGVSGGWGTALFRNKRFMLDEMFQQNTSKSAILLEYENPCSFFCFSFCATLFFPIECPGLSQHSPGHSVGEKIK